MHSYCIDIHVKQAKNKKSSKEEMAEAMMVATAAKAGSALAHGVNALQAYDELNVGFLFNVNNIGKRRD
jgi:alkylhydroperoxidase/carboxymuconolactone decarboxylase family protein YurZ